MNRLLAAVLGLALFAGPLVASAAPPRVGDVVLAQPEGQDLYYVGTVVGLLDTGCSIVFEDGDREVVPTDKVRALDVGVGSRVMARWKGEDFYPGRVTKIVGRALHIQFDDGDHAWVPWCWIAVK